MQFLRQGYAGVLKVGPFVDPATGLPVTGADIDAADVQLSKNQAAFGTKNDATNNAAHTAAGFYNITVDATDTGTLGALRMEINISADANTPMVVWEDYMILDPITYDMLFVANQFKNMLGITVVKGTMASPGGNSTTQGSFASGDGAKAKVGYLIWVPATIDLHRIKTLATDAWTVDSGDAFSTNPAADTYYIIANPLNLPLSSSDIATSFGQAVADRVLARNQQGAADSAPTVSTAIASGLMSLVMSGATLTVKHGDGTTAFTRTITRSQLDAIISLV